MRINSPMTHTLLLVMFLSLTGIYAKGGDPPSGTITDKDGNVYHTITIGTQLWMVENLKTTKYADGMRISNTTDNTTWINLTSPSYCWFNNDTTYKNTYGALYNWYTVNTGKLCPLGWHVPTRHEWRILTEYLGGKNIAGGKLKEKGTIHWMRPNRGATNETGFKAFPGGFRYYLPKNGKFCIDDVCGRWWSSTIYDENNAWYFDLYFSNTIGYQGWLYKQHGFSVRCLGD